MPSVLITRPREAAESLAVELEQLGYQTIIEPLLTIEPYNSPRPSAPADAVMITSSNALTAIAYRQTDIIDLFDKPCFCVGARTAERAKAFGFKKVQNSDSDGAELGQLIAGTLGQGKTILHIAGVNPDSKAHHELEQQGLRVAIWPVYEALQVPAFSEKTRQLLEKQKLDAIVLFSPRTAETLTKLLNDTGLKACCTGLAAICLSEPVANVVKPLNWQCLAIASAPAEKSLIASLQTVCPVKP